MPTCIKPSLPRKRLTVNQPEHVIEDEVGPFQGDEVERLRVALRMFIIIDLELAGDVNKDTTVLSSWLRVERDNAMNDFLECETLGRGY